MKTTISQRTRKVTTVTWSGMLTDDNGSRVASMNATLDLTHPLGTTSMIVLNQDLYAKAQKEVKAAYDALVEQVRETAESTVLVVDETDGEATPESVVYNTPVMDQPHMN